MPGAPRSADHRWGGGGGGGGFRSRPDDDSCSDRSSSSGDGRPDSIPIKVFHQKSGGGGQRPRYTGSGRNTTELPAAGRTSAATTNGESPRLERAHSEPPNKFTQRLNLGRAAGAPTTIPENGEAGNASAAGGVTSSATAGLKIPIKPSASAPSVSDSQPVPPPRRSPPRHQNVNNSSSTMSNSGQPPSSSNTAVPMASSGNVRHIPIFVEGRPEPIFNTSSSAGPPAQPPAAEMSFPKPSDYYPPGVQRIRSRDSECGTPPEFQFQPFADPSAFRTHTPTAGFRSAASHHPTVVTQPQTPASSAAAAPYVEPTTPMGPPPGPIPMGYVPTPGVPKEVIQEPTTPQGPPPGPIPMGYMPSAVIPPPPQQQQSSTEPTSPVAPPPGPIPMPCDPSLVSAASQPRETPSAPAAESVGSEESAASVAPPPPPPPPSTSSSARPRRSTVSPSPGSRPGNDEPDHHHHGASAGPPPPVVNFIPIRVEQGGSSSGRSSSATRQKQQPVPEVQAQTEEGEIQRGGTMPRSPAPPRKGGDSGGENAALLNKLDTIRQEVEKLGERIQNFKVR